MKRPPIALITNDDGIHSPGIWRMAEEIQKWAQVYVVAPSEQQSATSVSITVRRPLSIERHKEFSIENVWSISGTPADCVKTALSIILPETPDIVISGINRGSNAGKNLLYSGTIGGAIEAALRGIPAIAFSSYNMNHPAFEQYSPYTTAIAQQVLSTSGYEGLVLNVNFPCPELVRQLGFDTPIAGFKLARQGKEYLLEAPLLIDAPNQHIDHHQTIFHMGVRIKDDYIEQETSDIYWLKNGYATAVPVYVEDLTHNEFLNKEREKFEQIFPLQ